MSDDFPDADCVETTNLDGSREEERTPPRPAFGAALSVLWWTEEAPQPPADGT
ncbi:MAG: hypothetical protein KC657_17230 [Myxococcales bacterium]|nr:hypothetical protein [Myxococcales bacterium]